MSKICDSCMAKGYEECGNICDVCPMGIATVGTPKCDELRKKINERYSHDLISVFEALTETLELARWLERRLEITKIISRQRMEENAK